MQGVGERSTLGAAHTHVPPALHPSTQANSCSSVQHSAPLVSHPHTQHPPRGPPAAVTASRSQSSVGFRPSTARPWSSTPSLLPLKPAPAGSPAPRSCCSSSSLARARHACISVLEYSCRSLLLWTMLDSVAPSAEEARGCSCWKKLPAAALTSCKTTVQQTNRQTTNMQTGSQSGVSGTMPAQGT